VRARYSGVFFCYYHWESNLPIPPLSAFFSTIPRTQMHSQNRSKTAKRDGIKGMKARVLWVLEYILTNARHKVKRKRIDTP